MKGLKNILAKISLALLLLSANVISLQAQELEKAIVQNLIHSKNFVFNVQSVNAIGRIPNQNMAGYEVKLSGDSLVTYLPYFGRAFTATIGQAGGINFTSTKFEYKAKTGRKGRWDVNIKPKGDTNTDVREMIFSISENGYATLQVISNSRQPISYNGYISAGK